MRSRYFNFFVALGLLCLLGLWALASLGCVAPASQGAGSAKKKLHPESWYAAALAEATGGKTEVRMRNGTRCDVMLTHFAVEVEFASKWCEAIGQALNYASQTGRRGAVALIIEHESEERFLARLREVVAWHQLPIEVIVLRPFHDEGVTLEFPDGMPDGGRVGVRPAIDFSTPVDAMDWIPRWRGILSLELSTSTRPPQ